MEQVLKVLLLEDNVADAEIIQRFLKKENMNCEFRLAMDRAGFLHELEGFSPEIILSDHSIPQFSSNEALQLSRQKFTHIPFILVTGAVSEEFAANIIKQGADDYILKDRLARLPAAIEAALNHRSALKEINDYKYALDQSAIVAITDQKGIILYANDNFSKISKYTVKELIGQDHRMLKSGYHAAAYIKQLWTTIANGNIWRGEFCNKAKDGSIYWVNTTIVPFLRENGKPYQYMAIRVDITQQKKVEQELLKSNERFKYATVATSDIIWELNFETRQYIVHQGKEKLFGINTLLDWKLGVDGKYIIEQDRERITKSFRKSRMDPANELWSEEYRVYATDDIILYIINHAIFIRNEKGIATRAIGAITDISEKKKLENDLLDQQMKEQLKIISTALEAQEKERNSIGQELHDNVNQILAGAKLLLSSLKGQTKQTKEVIDTSLNYMQEAIDENKKISRALVTPDFEHIDLADQLDSLTNKMLTVAGIAVHIDTSRLKEEKMDDQHKITFYRIAQEQCSNIIKYSKATLVNIKISSTYNAIKMIIEDDGNGMEKNQKTKGIGLSNIKGRLSILNGTATIKTAPGEGFTLEIRIPLKNKGTNMRVV